MLKRDSFRKLIPFFWGISIVTLMMWRWWLNRQGFEFNWSFRAISSIKEDQCIY